MNTNFSSDALTDGDGAGIDIGNELLIRRLHLNLTQGQISDQLKIPLNQIQALENNHFDVFRSPVFARGYLKNYIRALGLDEVYLLSHFDTLQNSKKTVLEPIDKVKKQAHLTDPIVLFISVVLMSVLVFLVFWWPTMEAEDALEVTIAEENVTIENDIVDEDILSPSASVSDTESVSDSELQKELITEKLTIKSSDSVEESASDTDIVTGLSAETKALLKEAGVSVDAVALETQSITKNSEQAKIDTLAQEQSPTTDVTYRDDVVVNFKQDCWTEVRNQSGKILFSGIKKGGSTLTLSGSSSYRVVLGYAPGVSELLFKGKSFDFTSFIRKDLARFELK